MGAVVAGAIMLVNGGAKARGALLRDVAAFGIGVITITAFLGTGGMSYGRCAVLLAEYVAFVLIVLGADLWHIFTRCSEVPRPSSQECKCTSEVLKRHVPGWENVCWSPDVSVLGLSVEWVVMDWSFSGDRYYTSVCQRMTAI